MAGYHLTDDEWIASWKTIGSPVKFSQKHNISIRNVMARRRALETRHGITLDTFASENPAYFQKRLTSPGTNPSTNILTLKGITIQDTIFGYTYHPRNFEEPD
jgi:hypothetical protein